MEKRIGYSYGLRVCTSVTLRIVFRTSTVHDSRNEKWRRNCVAIFDVTLTLTRPKSKRRKCSSNAVSILWHENHTYCCLFVSSSGVFIMHRLAAQVVFLIDRAHYVITYCSHCLSRSTMNRNTKILFTVFISCTDLSCYSTPLISNGAQLSYTKNDHNLSWDFLLSYWHYTLDQ